jgi:hypothetical protein
MIRLNPPLNPLPGWDFFHRLLRGGWGWVKAGTERLKSLSFKRGYSQITPVRVVQYFHEYIEIPIIQYFVIKRKLNT